MLAPMGCRVSALLLLAFAACLTAAAARAGADDAAAELVFSHSGAVLRRISLEQLRAALPVERIEVDDPFYNKRKTFLAFRLADVFERVTEPRPPGSRSTGGRSTQDRSTSSGPSLDRTTPTATPGPTSS